MKTKSILDLHGALNQDPPACGPDAAFDRIGEPWVSPADLAESLRAMHRAARPHYSPAGGLPRVAVVMDEHRLSHLIHAANALAPALTDKALCAPVELENEQES
jgi:hypothetical protein